MARTGATIGYKTYLEKKRSTSPLVWDRVMEVKNVGGPSLARDAPEATNMDSDDGWKEFIKGLKDGGEVSFELNYLPGSENDTGGHRLGHNATDGILSDFSNDDTVDDWRVIFPNGVYMEFPGIVTAFEVDAPVDDVLSASCTMKVAGKPALDEDDS